MKRFWKKTSWAGLAARISNHEPRTSNIEPRVRAIIFREKLEWIESGSDRYDCGTLLPDLGEQFYGGDPLGLGKNAQVLTFLLDDDSTRDGHGF